jgi:glycosyltransferase involved in cell wall biosynthesis
MLCGCPVVLSDEIRGRFDIVEDGKTGFIYPCGNVDMLARILANALGERGKLVELSRNAVKRMETWTPRENVETAVMAIERAVQLRPRNVERQ